MVSTLVPDLAAAEAKLQRIGVTVRGFKSAAAFAVIGAGELRTRRFGPDVAAATEALARLAASVAKQAATILREHGVKAALVRRHVAAAVASLGGAAHEVLGSRILGAARRIDKLPKGLRAYSLPEFVAAIVAAGQAALPPVRFTRRDVATLLVAHAPASDRWPRRLRADKAWEQLSRGQRIGAVEAAVACIAQQRKDRAKRGGAEARRRWVFRPI